MCLVKRLGSAMGTRQMVPDPSTIQSTIRAVRCPKLPAPRFLVAAVAGFDLSAGWWSLPKAPVQWGLGPGPISGSFSDWGHISDPPTGP
jgi:hypothetical protein